MIWLLFLTQLFQADKFRFILYYKNHSQGIKVWIAVKIKPKENNNNLSSINTIILKLRIRLIELVIDRIWSTDFDFGFFSFTLLIYSEVSYFLVFWNLIFLSFTWAKLQPNMSVIFFGSSWQTSYSTSNMKLLKTPWIYRLFIKKHTFRFYLKEFSVQWH